MAILRTELIGRGSISQREENGILRSSTSGIYDGIVEAAADLALPRMQDFASGSMMFCLADHKLYIKDSSLQWQEVTE